jgi:hypothetical protein
VQGPLKIRNQLAIEPEIFGEVIMELGRQLISGLSLGLCLTTDIDNMMPWWGVFHVSNRLDH